MIERILRTELESVALLDTSALLNLSYGELKKLSKAMAVVVPNQVIKEFKKYGHGKEGVEKLVFIYSQMYDPELENKKNLIYDAFVHSNGDTGTRRMGEGDMGCIAAAMELKEMGYDPIVYTTDEHLKKAISYLGFKCN